MFTYIVPIQHELQYSTVCPLHLSQCVDRAICAICTYCTLSQKIPQRSQKIIDEAGPA